MSRLDDYRAALLAAHPDVAVDELTSVLDARGAEFAGFVVDHGLGPLWHGRTGREEFHKSRMLAEALFLAQEKALGDIDAAFDAASIEYVVIKGAANRLLLYDNPALRACHDLDVLVRREDRVDAAKALVDLGFVVTPKAANISRELELVRDDADIDLHWGLLREGRLRRDPTNEMMGRRRRVKGVWAVGADDTLFLLLVHPAFAKHLAAWGMGLHRVADLLGWLRTQEFRWSDVLSMLEADGVRAAAWATLRWTQLLAGEHAPGEIQTMLSDLRCGSMRRNWIDYWLRNDLPGRTSGARWTRLLGFSLFLHDTMGDALRAAREQRQAIRRSTADLAVFADLVSQ